jgi:acetyl esterase/lipase
MNRMMLACAVLLSFLPGPAGAQKKAVESVGEAAVYKKVEGRELKLHVVKPADWKAGDSRPAIVFFHGGGWVGGSPTQFNRASEYFASRGLVCVQVEYRLIAKGDKGPPVSCCRDAKSAMRWVRSRAKELGVDPARIASGGGSAGGHLAAFVGMVEGTDDPQDDKAISPKSNAMILFNPVFDNGPENGWGRERVGDRYKEFSPAHNIDKDDPPAIVFLGTKDNLIPVPVVERFKAGMTKAGVKCEAFFYDDQPHGFFNKDPWQTKTLIEADKFLASLGWLKGPPTLTPP